MREEEKQKRRTSKIVPRREKKLRGIKNKNITRGAGETASLTLRRKRWWLKSREKTVPERRQPAKHI